VRGLKISVRKQGDLSILDLSGELALGQGTALLEAESKRLLDDGERFFILNMLDVPWLDSSGIGEVFACFKRARVHDGVVKLVLQGKSRSLFTFTQLHKVFEIFGTLEEAVASFAGQTDGPASAP
jgi:anti-sigma B factor antagonist